MFFSGCNFEDNINYRDDDLGVPPIIMESKEACAQHSLTNDNALFWTFDKDKELRIVKIVENVGSENQMLEELRITTSFLETGNAEKVSKS